MLLQVSVSFIEILAFALLTTVSSSYYFSYSNYLNLKGFGIFCSWSVQWLSGDLFPVDN